ncbi:MAG: T9SS type A sorting domain-containing protein [Bacteroidota bacterium]
MKRIVYILLLVAATTLSSFTIFSINENGGKDEPRIVQFYPNPATSYIIFDLSSASDKNYTLQIYNFIGKKISETKITTARTSISLENFYRGLYVYQLRNKAGQIIESGKFQVSR